jgi:hypothetical protein
VSSLRWVADRVIVKISMGVMGKTEISNPIGNRIPLIRPAPRIWLSSSFDSQLGVLNCFHCFTDCKVKMNLLHGTGGQR